MVPIDLTFSVGDSAVVVDYYSDECLAFVIYTSCIRICMCLCTMSNFGTWELVLSYYSLAAIVWLCSWWSTILYKMKCKVADTVTQITQINFFSIYATVRVPTRLHKSFFLQKCVIISLS